jgi:hypothetical protein
MINLREELDRLGIKVSIAEFREAIRELHAVMFPSWSDEELLFHPENEGAAFLHAVRTRFGCGNLSDHLVLRTLINWRKDNTRKATRTPSGSDCT